MRLISTVCWPRFHAPVAGVSPFTAAASWAKLSTCGIMTFLGCIPDLPLNHGCRRFQESSLHFTKKSRRKSLSFGSPQLCLGSIDDESVQPPNELHRVQE